MRMRIVGASPVNTALTAHTRPATWHKRTRLDRSAKFPIGTASSRGKTPVSVADHFGFLRDWYPIDEYATVNWLEHMGYDVTYVANTDLETQPGLLLGHKAYLSPAHDEYVRLLFRDRRDERFLF